MKKKTPLPMTQSSPSDSSEDQRWKSPQMSNHVLDSMLKSSLVRLFEAVREPAKVHHNEGLFMFQWPKAMIKGIGQVKGVYRQLTDSVRDLKIRPSF
jgi:hypothetical protein